MRMLTQEIPRLRPQLLLYTNTGADALGSYLMNAIVATRRRKLGLDRQQTTQEARRQKQIGWGRRGEHQGSCRKSGGEADEAEEGVE